MKNLILLGVTLFSPIAMLGQSPVLSGQVPVSPSKEIGVFVFPKNGQSADQQLKDESECYSAAKQQSGIDPKAPAPISVSPEQKQSAQKPSGKSTTAVGTTHTQHEDSIAAKKEATAKAALEQKSQEERARLAHAEGLDTFQRAFSACMDARNYSVK